MTNLKILEEIETLRNRMIELYLVKDIDNAVKLSQKLDKKIYDYLLKSQNNCTSK